MCQSQEPDVKMAHKEMMEPNWQQKRAKMQGKIAVHKKNTKLKILLKTKKFPLQKKCPKT